MASELLKLITAELLREFGKGGAVPGSGSAAALDAMIAAKLLVTVVSVTNSPFRRAEHAKQLPELLQVQIEIEERIYPRLAVLFEEDSAEFGKAIELRKACNRASDPFDKQELTQQELDQLKPAIALPLEIAALAVEIATMAIAVFDNGLKDVRGDSQVALSGAVAALAGCISIVRLNLTYFGHNDAAYITQKLEEVAVLNSSRQYLNSEVESRIKVLEDEVVKKLAFYNSINRILQDAKSKQSISDADIEHCVRDLQLAVWGNRDIIWDKDVPTQTVQILDPKVIFEKVMRYGYASRNIGRYDDYEVAGIIDQSKKRVVISTKFNHQSQNFTAAHELGHIFLHEQAIMHRDRPIEGSAGKRSKVERQADKFAAYFLMPRLQVTQAFKQLFLTDKFKIDENTAFWLTRQRTGELKADVKNLRGLSLKLASAEFYKDGEPFISMANIFHVSNETMAIQLEEFGLVEFKL
jgi:Zn-dependent peptidase ImmA (M78 family)/formiminotetrahydrofolate cyclodeaminase